MLSTLTPDFKSKSYHYRLIDGTEGTLDLSVLPEPKVEGDLQELEELVEALFAAEFPDAGIRVYIGNPSYRGSWIVGYWEGDFFHDVN
ncbi:hypothetical protein LCGC14_1534550 [marine sediment metagenome]|uniref:Uncharacterized protein n=1 Tax=marine sediment metagenome TaxID=412755 RepID=A0A0F9LAN3_9ZZZZ